MSFIENIIQIVFACQFDILLVKLLFAVVTKFNTNLCYNVLCLQFSNFKISTSFLRKA